MELKNVIKMESYKRNEEEKIKTHRNLLEEILDPDSGLLDALLANKALSQAEKSQVDDRDPYSKRNCQLLDYIIENRQGHQFIATLQNSEQRHIANFLTANGSECSIYLEPIGLLRYFYSNSKSTVSRKRHFVFHHSG